MEERPTPRDTFILIRGAYDKPGDKVTPGVPAALPPLPPRARRRTASALARWLVSAEQPADGPRDRQPLLAEFFGTGLVKTAEDFGVQGEQPSHPELLDWLADRVRARRGWDVKRCTG